MTPREQAARRVATRLGCKAYQDTDGKWFITDGLHAAKDDPSGKTGFSDRILAALLDRDLALGEAVEALRKYGRHAFTCATRQQPYKGKRRCQCDCGLDAAIQKGEL